MHELSNSQLLIWTGQKLSPHLPLYNEVFQLRIQGHVDPTIFNEAVQQAIKANAILRSRFIEVDGMVGQEFIADYAAPVEFLDLSGSQNPEHNWSDLLAVRSSKLFDLSIPPYDIVLVRLKDLEHIIFVNMHHIITDAQSVGLLLNEIGRNYKSISLGETCLEENGDFTVFLDEQLALKDNKDKNIEAYWSSFTQQNVLSLYGSKLTSNASTQRVEVPLSQQLSNKIKSLVTDPRFRGLSHQLDLYNFFGSVLITFLGKVSGEDDIVIGSPCNGRENSNSKNSLGLFIELFPLYCQRKTEDSFLSLYKRFASSSFDYLRHAKPGYSNARLNKGFNVVYNYSPAQFEPFNDLETKTTWTNANNCDPSHQLRYHVHDFDGDDQFTIQLDLNTSAFSEKIRTQIPEHLHRLIERIVEHPEELLGEISLLDEAEVLLPELPHGLSLIEVIDSWATNQDVALGGSGYHFTYAQLYDEVRLLANGLVKAELIANPICIYMDRSPDYIVAMYAILYAGGSFVPISKDQPAQRIQSIISQAQSTVVLFEDDKVDNEELIQYRISQLADPDDQFIKRYANPMAYVMFTSGSSGRPKGVAVSLNSLEQYIMNAKELYGSSRIAMPFFTSIGFDLTLTSLFLPMVTGGHIEIFPQQGNYPDLSILDVMENKSINTLKLTPSHLALVSDANLRSETINTLILGGENLRTDVAKNARNNFAHDVRIFNEYGPTEACVGCIVHEFNPVLDNEVSVPIGRVVNGMSAKIIDDFGQPVPNGVLGQLALSGGQLAMEYLSNSEETERKFRINNGVRSYLTGDICRINDNGDFQFLGRKDDQIKIGGVRIEGAEIEAAFQGISSIQQGAVVLSGTHEALNHCKTCGLSSAYPRIKFDDDGICELCHSFEMYKKKAQSYFRTMDDLQAIFDNNKSDSYDCIMLYSGGKDSSYALAKLVEMGLNVLAFTLDNGFISDHALANIKKITDELNVDCIIGKTEHMNAIFTDSLKRHSNVCNGCFKTIYTLSAKIALEKNIKFIVTGLSRGQFFETRLTEELFMDSSINATDIDSKILEARKAYHKVDDAVSQLLDVSMLQQEDTFSKITYLDFYRYTDVSLSEMYDYLDNRLPWVRPADTGRSTNCIINKLGIYVHRQEQGYSNYSFPYSWDVRVGHKTLDECLDEVNEEINEAEVLSMMNEIGYDGPKKQAIDSVLHYFYTGQEELSSNELRQWAATKLPNQMMPHRFIRVDSLPMTKNGKVDSKKLLEQSSVIREDQDYVAPNNEIEKILCKIYQQVLAVEPIGITHDFFAIGGTSLAAIRIAARIKSTMKLDLPIPKIFENATIKQLAIYIEGWIRNELAK